MPSGARRGPGSSTPPVDEGARRRADIVASSADAMIALTTAGVVTEWNPGAERLYGYRAAEMIGQLSIGLGETPTGMPPGHEHERAEILHRVALGATFEHLESTRVHKDGSTIDISWSAAPIFDHDGAVVGIATVARDISKQKSAERERLTLGAKLRQSERMESIGRLVGGIAHDFNNLLAIVLMYSDFVAARLPPDDVNQPDLSQIRDAAERARRFTRQLMTFARSGPVVPVDLDLDDIVRPMEPLLRQTLPSSIKIVVSVAPDLWPICVDRGQMEQVLLNLVSNAGDAMPTGGTLTITSANVTLDAVAAARHGDLVVGRYVELTVVDTGQGMSKEVSDRAFEPFFTTKPPGEGSGLGLATVYGVVKQAEGRVTIDSRPGIGTGVHILLPAVDVRTVERASAGPVQTIAAAPAPSGTILVVEDEPAVLSATTRILRAAGYTVLGANDPAEAIALLQGRTGPLDLLLTDMVMPGMSGRDLARSLRRSRPDLRVAYMTGYSQELVTPQLGELGGPLLQKPFTRGPLLAMVARVLNGPA